MNKILAGIGWCAVTMANAFAADASTEPRLSGRPACIGTEIAPELMGTYQGKAHGALMTLSLGEGSVTYLPEHGSPENAKAWTCRKSGALVLVAMKGHDRYMSRLILQGGQYLIDLGDVLPGQTLGPAELQKLTVGDGVTVLKKQMPGNHRVNR